MSPCEPTSAPRRRDWKGPKNASGEKDGGAATNTTTLSTSPCSPAHAQSFPGSSRGLGATQSMTRTTPPGGVVWRGLARRPGPSRSVGANVFSALAVRTNVLTVRGLALLQKSISGTGWLPKICKEITST